MSRMRWTNEEIELLSDLYLSNVHWTKILENFPGRTWKSLERKVWRLGITNQGRKTEVHVNPNSLENLKLGPEATWVPYNKQFFKEPSILNSFWAGFLSADGCVQHKASTYLTISLAPKDECILEHLIRDMNYEGKIHHYDYGDPYCHISLGSFQETAKDLERNFNITPRKTFTAEPPDLEDNFIPSFLIGLLDGDGTIAKHSKTAPYIRFLGTKQMLEWVKESLIRLELTDSEANVHPHKSIFLYQINGKKALSLIRQLREVPVPKLERKWNQQWLVEML